VLRVRGHSTLVPETLQENCKVAKEVEGGNIVKAERRGTGRFVRD